MLICPTVAMAAMVSSFRTVENLRSEKENEETIMISSIYILPCACLSARLGRRQDRCPTRLWVEGGGGWWSLAGVATAVVLCVYRWRTSGVRLAGFLDGRAMWTGAGWRWLWPLILATYVAARCAGR